MKSAFFALVLLAASSSYATQCKDFSGIWVGTCTTAGTTYPYSRELTQVGCDHFYYDRFKFQFDGVTELKADSAIEQTSFSEAVNWNPDHQSFRVKQVVHSLSLSEKLNNAFVRTSDYKIENDKFIIDMNSTWFKTDPSGITVEENYKDQCVFTKSTTPLPLINQPDANCANFAGYWKGECTDLKGVKSERKEEIGQFGCRNMRFGLNKDPFSDFLASGQTMYTVRSLDHLENFKSNFQWEPGNQSFTIVKDYDNQDLKTRKRDLSSVWERFSLKDGNLQIESKSTRENQTGVESCVLSKSK